ncbi:MAG: DUF975 family protein [Clostridiales bacterium]|nr:DUF975 family protein [Clostridiales bacterium]
MDFKEFKQHAKSKLSDHWPILIVITIIVLIVSGMGDNSARQFSNGFAVDYGKSAGSLLSLILSGPLALGTANFYLRLVNKNEAKIERFFDGFKNFLNAFVLHVMTTVFILLWTLLLIVPGIIAAINYSMAFLIMSENEDISPMDAIEKSKMLMKNHKMEYFSFILSFFGWVIIGILTFGLGFLYLYPYFYASKIYFYRSIKGETEDYEYILESKKP